MLIVLLQWQQQKGQEAQLKQRVSKDKATYVNIGLLIWIFHKLQ